MKRRKTVKCIQCHTENERSLSHCEKCGASLPVIKRSVPRTVVIFLAVLLVWAGGFAYFARDIIFHSSRMLKIKSAIYKEKTETVERKKRKDHAVKDKKKKIAPKSNEIFHEDRKSGKEVIAGWVVINDRWGREVNKFRAGLAGDGWLALPARACLGGNSWHFYTDPDRKAEISGGLWIYGDKVGLWHLTEDREDLNGPELASWDDREAVSWISLESDNEYNSIKLNPGLTEGFFLSASLPDRITETGIFVQSGKIVGWSFGKWLAKAYMWRGKTGAALEYRTWVRYFYNMTFANGREEKFAGSLAMQKGYTIKEQLASFVEGFRMQPKLSIEDTPDYLLPEEIIKQMRVLVTNAVSRGEGSKVVDVLNGQALKIIGDAGLLIEVIPVIASVSGFEAAIGEIDDSGRYIMRESGIDVPALDKLHMDLYQDWLKSLVSDREVDKGLQTYNAAKAYYQDDPGIHLLGVELLILNGDWEEAERLLYMKDYPLAFQDRYQILAGRISEMKELAEQIVINFPRGSNRVTLTAVINGAADQDLLVDTGATVVTIPSSTADALGLEIVPGDRTLATAGGAVSVNEVIIDALEINGWVEHDIRAIVLDMPDRPELGLLGTNYLGRFDMDLKPEEGTLVLTPR
jgi:clan AA aspartic protease (TIGR02281 family)